MASLSHAGCFQARRGVLDLMWEFSFGFGWIGFRGLAQSSVFTARERTPRL